MAVIKNKKIISLLFTFAIMTCLFVMPQSALASTTAMAKPSVTLSKSSATTVKIKWKKVSGAKKYTVYRSTSKTKGFKAIKTTNSLSFNSTGLTCGKTYYFKVKATNGKRFSISTVKSIKVLPLKVSNAKFTKGCTFLKVNWSKSSGASGYEVYYSASKSGKFSKLASTKNLYYKNSNLKLGTTRYYKVRAYKIVNKKRVYGSFSSVVGGKSYSSHTPSTSWKIVKKPTCNAVGKRENTCKYCKKQYSETIHADSSLHQYVKSVVPANEKHCPFVRYTCKVCGNVYDSTVYKHKFQTAVTYPTCTEAGYTTFTCTRDNCGYSYVGNSTPANGHNYVDVEIKPTCTSAGYIVKQCSVCKQYAPDVEIDPNADPLGHIYGDEYVTTEEGYRAYICTVCHNQDEPKMDYTCYIDLTNQTVSVPAVASFNSSASSVDGTIDKLDLITDGKSNFEITGEATNLTIDVNASTNVEIKLNNVTITNDSMDCFDVKNKSTTIDEVSGATIVPTVSFSIKDATTNNLITTKSGNAIESSCKLEIKGHGTVNMNTVSTTISSKGKIELKNATVNITSANRGIDTKNDILNDAGLLISTDYSSVNIKPNVNLIINSFDDGIRCKNMEISAIGETDVNSVINITSKIGDGIQLEGNTGFHAYSGDITIDAGKYAFNCASDLIIFDAGVSKGNCKGDDGFSK